MRETVRGVFGLGLALLFVFAAYQMHFGGLSVNGTIKIIFAVGASFYVGFAANRMLAQEE
jgi:hypothetical protein